MSNYQLTMFANKQTENQNQNVAEFINDLQNLTKKYAFSDQDLHDLLTQTTFGEFIAAKYLPQNDLEITPDYLEFFEHNYTTIDDETRLANTPRIVSLEKDLQALNIAVGYQYNNEEHLWNVKLYDADDALIGVLVKSGHRYELLPTTIMKFQVPVNIQLEIETAINKLNLELN